MKKKTCILICGDICPTIDTQVFFDEANEKVLLNDVLPLFKQSDVIFGNLEFALTDTCQKAVKTGPILFGKLNYINLFKKLNFSALSLANNHIKDCGTEGVVNTIEICNKNAIPVVGAGINNKTAKEPLIIEKNGWKIGIMAFAEHEFNAAYKNEPGANLLDLYTDFDQITAFKKKVDYLIILYHGGIEYYEYPSPVLKKKCRKMIDSGADYVTCQHSHVIGTQEQYKTGTILYGQGNTIFGYKPGNENWNRGLLINIELNKDKQPKINHTLTKATEKGVCLGNEKEQKEINIILEQRTKNINKPDFIETSWNQFCEKQKALVLPHLFGQSRFFNKLNRLLNNKLIDTLYSKKKKMITLNLVRCEAHHEVIQTILKNTQK